MTILTQITGAIIGVGAVVALAAPVILANRDPEPVRVTCTDAMLVPRPETDAIEIFLTCQTSEAEPVLIDVPPIPGH